MILIVHLHTRIFGGKHSQWHHIFLFLNFGQLIFSLKVSLSYLPNTLKPTICLITHTNSISTSQSCQFLQQFTQNITIQNLWN